jgi:hypothetical protein
MRNMFLHVGVMAARAIRAIRSNPRDAPPGDRTLQHRELVSEQGQLGEQRPA